MSLFHYIKQSVKTINVPRFITSSVVMIESEYPENMVGEL